MADRALATTAVARPAGSAGHGALYRRLLGARIRSDWQYRTSFLTFLAGQALVTTFDFVTIVLLFQLVPGLGGWGPTEVAVLYGLATLPFGIADLLVSPVERVSRYVREGTFDRLLLRPIPALLQLSALEFELRRAGKLLPALGVLAWALPRTEIATDPGRIALVVLAVVCGTVIYSALWILSAALAFWVVATQEATYAATYGGQFASQYPLHLYRGWIRVVLGWAIPLAFVAYVPAVRVLEAPNPLGLPGWLVFASAPVAALTLVVALGVWRLGVRRYQSTGS